jgi:hypothetical protein
VVSRILIIAEGTLRPEAEEKTPALDLFDGPVFALARSLIGRGDWPKDVNLYVLTSEYGLVPAEEPLEPAVREMTGPRVDEAIYENYGRLAAALAVTRPAQLMLVLPEQYRRALLRKETPHIQGIPIAYLDASAPSWSDRLVSWLRSEATI